MSVVAVQTDALGHREQLLNLREKALFQHEAHVAQREQAVTAATDALEEVSTTCLSPLYSNLLISSAPQGFRSFSEAKQAAHTALVNSFPRGDSARSIVNKMEHAFDVLKGSVSDVRQMMADVRSPRVAPLPVKPVVQKSETRMDRGTKALPAKPPASEVVGETAVKGVFGKKFSKRK